MVGVIYIFFHSFLKVVGVIVKIIEAPMCYIGVIGVYVLVLSN